MHYLFGLDCPQTITSSEPAEVSHDLLSRMADMYVASKHLFTEEDGTLWGEVKRSKGHFLSAMENKDIPALEEQIGNLLKNDLLQGMSHGEALILDDKNHPYCKNYFAIWSTDLLISLGEALGCSPLQNREQSPILQSHAYVNQDLVPLLHCIEEKLGFSIEVPKFGNAPAILVGTKRLSPDSIIHAYTAYKLKELGATKNSVIVEIGGGHGMAALMARRAGLENYTIIDLPYVNAMQFGFLGSVFNNDVVKGYGEFDHTDTSIKGLKLISTSAIKSFPAHSVDFVINSDSLPEIPLDVATDYTQEIKRICRGLFLSLNQESGRPHPDGTPQGHIPTLIKNVGGFERVSRNIFWMRQGYVEEVYNCNPKNNA